MPNEHVFEEIKKQIYFTGNCTKKFKNDIEI